jgi:8-oxo-dGTP pyrophosphatase MutT (NUDIX family)
MQSDNPWTKLSSEVIYKNKWYLLRRDKVLTPDKEPGEYNVIEAADGAFVIALDKDENVQLIRKYRYTTDIYSLEVPAGGIQPDEQPLEAAKRELQEELGVVAKSWQPIGRFQAENAYVNNFIHVFVARDLEYTGQHDQLAEGINKTERISFSDVLQLIKNGEITDSQSMSALFLVALHLGIIH